MIRQSDTSEDWQAALSARGPNGYTKHSFVGDQPRAGYWRIRKAGADPVPIRIVELAPTDEETGELVGDVIWQAFARGAPVPVPDVWPFAAKMPITKQEHDEMMGNGTQPAADANIPPPHAQLQSVRAPALVAYDVEQTPALDLLAAALAEAQADMKGALKDSLNPHFRSSYADLASVREACLPALNKHGLAVVQFPASSDGATVTVITQLLHKSGQWMRGRLTMKPFKADPQGLGSAITYARRYALAAVAGVAPEDDDGEGAMGRQTKPEPRPASNGRSPHRTDETLQRATEFANNLAGELEKAKTTAYALELLDDPETARRMKWVEANYPEVYQIISRARLRITTKGAAA